MQAVGQDVEEPPAWLVLNVVDVPKTRLSDEAAVCAPPEPVD